MNRLLLDALNYENQSRPPVWLMRQAGRYLPTYRALRSKHSFLEMVRTPELAVEVTLMPIKQLNMDAAILFCDILVLLEALNMKLHFDDGSGPVIETPLTDASSVACLPAPCIRESLGYVSQTIQQLLPQLKVPLIGFCGAPFTLASYMIEGKSSRDLRKTKQWMLKDPDSFHRLLHHLALLAIEYLTMQVEAGVQAIQIFDSWANYLGHTQFREFSLAYLKLIVDAMQSKGIPIILFCRGSSVFATQLAEIQPAAVSLDWNSDLLAMRHLIPKGIALQGNLDPDVLYAPQPVIKREAQRLLAGMKGHPGYIFNLGHGILPDVPHENVKFLVETIQCHHTM
jgi:uroporphyrinogen decarboxylase